MNSLNKHRRQLWLLKAIGDNDLEAIRGLVGGGVCPTTPALGKFSPLRAAIHERRPLAVKLLLGLGAHPVDGMVEEAKDYGEERAADALRIALAGNRYCPDCLGDGEVHPPDAVNEWQAHPCEKCGSTGFLTKQETRQ